MSSSAAVAGVRLLTDSAAAAEASAVDDGNNSSMSKILELRDWLNEKAPLVSDQHWGRPK